MNVFCKSDTFYHAICMIFCGSRCGSESVRHVVPKKFLGIPKEFSGIPKKFLGIQKHFLGIPKKFLGILTKILRNS